ncbi:MAG: DUF5723 family protein [Catalinimonas sp.]
MLRLRLFCLLLGLTGTARAQSDLLLLTLPPTLQTTSVSPSMVPSSRFAVAIPVLSGRASGHHSAFPLRAVVRNDTLDPGRGLDRMNRNNLLAVDAHLDYLFAGVRLRKWYLTLSMSEHAEARAAYDGRIAELLWRGNAPFVGQTLSLDRLEGQALLYRALAVGVAYRHDDWTFGLRPRLLWGRAALRLHETDLRLRVAEGLLTAEYDARYRYDEAEELFSSDLDDGAYILPRRNLGWGIDGSVTYEGLDAWTFTVGWQNSGRIYWNTRTSTERFSRSGTYTGFTDEDYDGTETLTLQRVLDTLEATFLTDGTTQRREGFGTWLTPRLYAASRFALNDEWALGGAVQAEFYDGFRPAASVSATRRFGRLARGVVGYTVRSRDFTGLGAGVVITSGPVELHVVSDHVVSLFALQAVRSAHLRIGCNILFGGKPGGSAATAGTQWSRSTQ